MDQPGRISGPFDVSFRPLAEGDLEDIRRWQADPEVHAYYGEPPPTVAAARRDYLLSDPSNPTWRYAIEWSGRSVGEIQHYRRYPGRDWLWDAGIDIFIGEPSARGRGVGIESIRVMLRHLFEVEGVHRVHIEPEVANRRAIHVYERAGFRRDGIVRHHAFEHGDYLDVQFLTILDEEWPAARARWEKERGPLDGRS